jgi:hypothetical protein
MKEGHKYTDLTEGRTGPGRAAKFMPLKKMKIQQAENEFEVLIRDSHIIYLLFDSHYYMEGWKPKHSGRVLIVGGEFVTSPGHYKLPQN